MSAVADEFLSVFDHFVGSPLKGLKGHFPCLVKIGDQEVNIPRSSMIIFHNLLTAVTKSLFGERITDSIMQSDQLLKKLLSSQILRESLQFLKMLRISVYSPDVRNNILRHDFKNI